MSRIKLLLGLFISVGCIGIIIILALTLPPNGGGANNENLIGNNNGTVSDDRNNCTNLIQPFGAPYVYFSSYDDYIEVYWNTTSPIEQCIMEHYRAVLTTDTSTYREIPPNIETNLSRKFYCFKVTLTIESKDVNNKDTSQSSVTYTMAPVKDLVASNTNGSLIATWTGNPLQEQCHIKYEVTFNSTKGTKIYTVNQPIATTESLYCINVTVNVIPKSGDIRSEDSNITIPGDYPDSLPPIADISINTTATSAVISWNPPKSAESCVDLYTVLAWNENTGENAKCQGTANCELNLSSFCPSSQFIIRPTSPIKGKALTKRFVCSKNQPL